MKTRIAVLLFAVFIAACGGDEQTNIFNWERASLTYSYPANGQAAVPLHAPMVLRFSDALTTTDPLAQLSLETAGGEPVPFTATLTADGRSTVLTPDAPLAPATDYVLDSGDQDTDVGAVSFPEDGVRFTTRIEPDGPGEGARTDTTFRVERMIPDGGDMPLMDFSSLRLQFTQPIDRGTLDYGTTVSFQGDSGLVEANVIASGPYLTIDPVSDLDSGATYHLQLGAGLASTLGNALVPGDYADLEIVPENSGAGATLVQKAGVSNDTVTDQCGPDTGGDRLSPLTGEPINCVPIASLLLGDKTSSQQEGDVHAELASLNRYPHMTPLRIPRGSLLKGASVDVNVAGEVPVRFASGDASTGEISVRFVSDANGYMFRNPYTDDAEAPRHIRLFMDVAMNTANTEANASLSQDLMHLELVGTAIIIDGRMTIDAVGVVEPEVLGLETAYGTLSFHMESYRDQTNPPLPDPDDAPLEVQSWVPGNHADKHRPGDPITVNFNKPVDRNSLKGNVGLKKGNPGSDEPFDWYLDGASLVIKPDSALEFGVPYEVTLTQAVTDISGMDLADPADHSLTFSLPEYVGGGVPPIALTAYPGFPCAKANGSLNLANDDQGRCRGGESDDDHLPVMELPANRSIHVQFSQDMNADSIVPGAVCGEGTFRVERVAVDGSGNPVVDGNGRGVCDSAVPGRLEVSARGVVFTPEQPWEAGVLYRYTLMSENNDFDAPDCTRVQTQPASPDVAICSTADQGLQTALLTAPDNSQGGPDMENYFRGGPAVDSVFQALRNLPTFDVNSNFVHEYAGGESDVDVDAGTGLAIPSPNSTRLEYAGLAPGGFGITDANIGCHPDDEPCPERKVIHLTGALNGEVLGYDAGEDAVKVGLYPTRIVTTSLPVEVLVLFVWESAPTGPQIMRMRYGCDNPGDAACTDPNDTSDVNDRNSLVTGWIRKTGQGPVFETELDLYLDAPYLAPPLGATHNQHSYPISLSLSGPVTFLPDGRMQIEQLNTNSVRLRVETVALGLLNNTLLVDIPVDGANLNYVSLPVKD